MRFFPTPFGPIRQSKISQADFVRTLRQMEISSDFADLSSLLIHSEGTSREDRIARAEEICNKYHIDASVLDAVKDDAAHQEAWEVNELATARDTQRARTTGSKRAEIDELKAERERRILEVEEDIQRRLDETKKKRTREMNQFDKEVDHEIKRRQAVIVELKGGAFHLDEADPDDTPSDPKIEDLLDLPPPPPPPMEPSPPSTPMMTARNLPVRQARLAAAAIEPDSPGSPDRTGRGAGRSKGVRPWTAISNNEFLFWVIDWHVAEPLVELLFHRGSSNVPVNASGSYTLATLADFPVHGDISTYENLQIFPGTMVVAPILKQLRQLYPTLPSDAKPNRNPLFVSYEHPVTKVRKLFMVAQELSRSARAEWVRLGEPRFDLTLIPGLTELAEVRRLIEPNQIKFFGGKEGRMNCALQRWRAVKDKF
jgi:hypothetical protein